MFFSVYNPSGSLQEKGECMYDKLFHYKAIITEAYDGDTVTADLDLGLGVWAHGEKLRLFGINAPEMRGADKVAGTASRDFVRELILGKTVFIQTRKDKKGKYGRYLADIWLEESEGNWININQRIVEAGHAVYKDY
jgi:micrococcal nuclease